MKTLRAAWRELDAARHRAHLYRTWSAGADAGFTVGRSLEIIGALDDPETERARRWLIAGAARGIGLADLVASSAAHLSPLEQATIALGAETGRLPQTLRLLAAHYARQHRLLLGVRKRAAYPMLVALVAALLLPAPILVRGSAGTYLIAVAGSIAGCLLLGGAIVSAMAERHQSAPSLVRARLARALALAIEAGAPLPQAVRLAAAASGALPVQQFVARLDERTLAGQPLQVTLAGCPMVTPELLSVLATAERTGDFRTTLTRCAELYEDGFR